MNIALIGYGQVAKAFMNIIKDNNNLTVKYIIKSNGGIYIDKIEEQTNLSDLEKNKSWNSELTYKNITKDKAIDLVIELTNTEIETGEPALTHIIECINEGKHVVTGNKGAIINGYKKINRISKEKRVEFGIGCTLGGALPTYIVGKDGLAGSSILSIEGIFNGTSNYILELMYKEEISFSEALKKAQKIGIAEKNSKLDTQGFDTAAKLLILVNTLLNQENKIDDVEVKGIEEITVEEVVEAKKMGGAIKLVGRYDGKDKFKVAPEFINEENLLYGIKNKNKGVVFKTDLLGEIFIAGGESSPVGAAASIIRDIINIKTKLICQ